MITKLIPIALIFFLPFSGLAQIQWRVTHGTASQGPTKLIYSSMRIAVFPGYLDVEEEVEVGLTGAVAVGGDANSLEIFGNFDMVPGSTIISMLLWNGDAILKARLKGRNEANEQYEKVVDRNVTPPERPRDPALIVHVAGNTYRMLIYPAAMGKTRKLRLRYHIPCQMAPGGLMLRVRSVFAPNIPDNPGQVQVRLEAGEKFPVHAYDYALYVNGKPRMIVFPTTYLLTLPEDVFLSQNPPLRSLSLQTAFPEGTNQGHYLGYYGQVPGKILNYPLIASNPNAWVEAIVRNEKDSYSLMVNCKAANGGFQCDPLEFHGKAPTAWSPMVEWNLYNGSVKKLLTVTDTPAVFTRPNDSTQVALWAGSAYPFAEIREKYLGVKYGFVDRSVSLLALEQDSLTPDLRNFYALQGVPRLTRAEIIPPDTSDKFVPIPVPGTPGNPGSTGIVRMRKLPRSYAGISTRVVEGAIPALQLAWTPEAALPSLVRVTLYGLDGRKLQSWGLIPGLDRSFMLPLPGWKSGFYFLTVEGKGIRMTQKILLR